MTENNERRVRFLAASLGSEVLRALRLRDEAGQTDFLGALERAENIGRKILEIAPGSGAAEEISIVLKELSFMKNGVIHDSPASWEKYFNPFALRAAAELGLVGA